MAKLIRTRLATVALTAVLLWGAASWIAPHAVTQPVSACPVPVLQATVATHLERAAGRVPIGKGDMIRLVDRAQGVVATVITQLGRSGLVALADFTCAPTGSMHSVALETPLQCEVKEEAADLPLFSEVTVTAISEPWLLWVTTKTDREQLTAAAVRC